MRIITGTARGRKLKSPEGLDIRPTTDNVKESIFNIIQNDIEGREVLDLFAGTGQMGIEALSRGAAHAVFVDRDVKALSLVKANLSLCSFPGELIHTDALSYLRGGRKADLIFVDPPYDSGLYDTVLKAIAEFDILRPGGIIVMESRRDEPAPELPAPYERLKEYRYGKVKVTTYTRKDNR